MRLNCYRLFFLVVIVFTGNVHAFTPDEKEKQTIIDQNIKLDALSLAGRVRELVEDTAFPVKQRLEIYLSHGAGKYFVLEKVSVIIDGEDRSEYVYNSVEQKALLRGGINRIYIGKQLEGFHELVAIFEGKDRAGNVIKKAKTWFIDKRPGSHVIELQVKDNENTLRPDIKYLTVRGGK